MSLTLPPEFERAVLDRVRSGQFASPENVLSAMMVALDDAEAEYDSKLEALRREIDVGLESEKRDPLIPGEEVEAWLRARVDEDEASEWLRARIGRIPAHLRAFVDEEVRLGRYESADKVIEMALAVLHDSQLIEDAAREELLREINFAIESGGDEETDREPEDLRRELQVGRDAIARGEGIPAGEARQLIMNWRDEEDTARTT